MAKKLTIKQKRFADEYIISGNATQSAISAGYSKKTANVIGSENLTKLYIKTYIEERLEKIDSKKIADSKEVLEYLTSVVRGDSESEVVVVEGVGDGCSKSVRVKKTPDEKEKLKAAELLGKRYGLFKDKIDLDVTAQVIIGGEDDLED